MANAIWLMANLDLGPLSISVLGLAWLRPLQRSNARQDRHPSSVPIPVVSLQKSVGPQRRHLEHILTVLFKLLPSTCPKLPIGQGDAGQRRGGRWFSHKPSL